MNDYYAPEELCLLPFPQSRRFNGLNTLLIEDAYELNNNEYPSPQKRQTPKPPRNLWEGIPS